MIFGDRQGLGTGCPPSAHDPMTTRKKATQKTTPAIPEGSSNAPRPRGRPRQVPLEAQREAILAAATRVFATEGFDGATSEKIAEEAGVARPTVYQLFGSKNEVFLAALDRALTRIFDHIRRSLSSTTDVRGRKQARSNIAAYFRVVSEEPDTFRMLQIADSTGDAATRKAAVAIRGRMRDAVAQYIGATWEGFQALDPRDAALAATLIADSVETAAVYHLEHRDRSTEEVVQFVADFVWSGVYDLAVGHNIPAGRRGAQPVAQPQTAKRERLA
jgi:AcrR family transcriptional regulator